MLIVFCDDNIIDTVHKRTTAWPAIFDVKIRVKHNINIV